MCMVYSSILEHSEGYFGEGIALTLQTAVYIIRLSAFIYYDGVCHLSRLKVHVCTD